MMEQEQITLTIKRCASSVETTSSLSKTVELKSTSPAPGRGWGLWQFTMSTKCLLLLKCVLNQKYTFLVIPHLRRLENYQVSVNSHSVVYFHIKISVAPAHS